MRTYTPEGWQKRRKAYEGRPVPEGIAHGSQSWARRAYRCECADCVNPEPRVGTPHAERQRKLRQAKRGKPVPPGTKHGIYAYRTYQCRCGVCLEAKVRDGHRRKNPWMYRPTRGRWREENGVTTLCWPPEGAGSNWRCVCDAQREVS